MTKTVAITQRLDQSTQNQRFVEFDSFTLEPKFSSAKQL